ncbi:hypothetical protein [Aquabacterium sp. CECT 9606]|uniref:hypothetical protein n=1 Tax=Aquabacterium sp. CECT 9606 TaxID=2845822 RepID=UPI001E594E8A|nr:hypothetical protein [Aquabacterium sp. CECT 9606]CAH0355602.1 hypothetical protein AQB9606_04296 [Aquabacterium sp. CECT 9606]
MTHRSYFSGALAAVALCCAGVSSSVWAQASSPTEGGQQPTTQSEALMPPGVAAKNSAVKTLDQTQGTPATRSLKQGDALSIRGGLITHVGSGQPVSEGSRVLRLPGKCTPKTNSLDCVAEAGQAPTGANVSSRVRNSVIGEVGAGRAATEGSGTVKRKEACTPAPGKLTCD